MDAWRVAFRNNIYHGKFSDINGDAIRNTKILSKVEQNRKQTFQKIWSFEPDIKIAKLSLTIPPLIIYRNSPEAEVAR